MYIVEIRHHCKGWRNGDLEDKLEIVDTKLFKTRAAGKEFIENALSSKPQKQVQKYYHKGNTPSNCYYFTGMTWIHENSGEEMEEYYQYTLKKAITK